MQLISEKEYNKSVGQEEYYKSRWGYFSEVIKMAAEVDANRVLEIGVRKLPIFKDSETMDIEKEYPGLTYQRDATILPYEFKDNEFDLLVAMQCLEHLHPKQKEVFREWKRIAKVVIISLPYLWDCPDDIMHHNSDMNKIGEWTGMKPSKIVINSARVILKYE